MHEAPPRLWKRIGIGAIYGAWTAQRLWVVSWHFIAHFLCNVAIADGWQEEQGQRARTRADRNELV